MGGRFTKLRLGRIDFLNVLPVYYPLESGVLTTAGQGSYVTSQMNSWITNLDSSENILGRVCKRLARTSAQRCIN